MAQLQGTNFQAPIVPNDSNDVFATHLAKYGQGGLRTVATLAERDAITPDRREFGMEVKVLADGKKYELHPTSQQVADNSNWQEMVSGGPAVTEWAAGLQQANSLVLFNGNVYRVKADIANGQSSPEGNPQYYQPLTPDVARSYVDAADQALQAAINAEKSRMDTLVQNAPQALDTLKEIADQLAADETGTAAILATQQQHTQQLADVVHLTGAETLSGRKTFVSPVTINTTADNGLNVTISAGNAYNPVAQFLATNNNGAIFFAIGRQLPGSALFGHSENDQVAFFTTHGRPLNDFTVGNNGNVGIGTGSSTERLEVAGNVKAVKFIGDGSLLTNLPATGGGGVSQAYVDGADTNLQSQITAEKQRMDTLVQSAPQALDTLKEIADQLAADEAGTAAILATQQQHTQQLAALPQVAQDLASNSTANVPSVAATVAGINAAAVYKNLNASTIVGLDFTANNNTYTANQLTYSSFGRAISGNTFSLVSYCTFGNNVSNNNINGSFSYNVVGNSFQNNYVGSNLTYSTFADNVRNCTFYNNITHLTVGPQCSYLLVNNNCKRVQIYNCQGTASAPFEIPANTVDAIYRNNKLVAVSSAPYQYPVAGAASSTITSFRNLVVNGTFTNGELQGTQPNGSQPGHKFSSTGYLYEYTLSAADTDCTRFVWVRTPLTAPTAAAATPATKTFPAYTATADGAQSITLPSAGTTVVSLQALSTQGFAETVWLGYASIAGSTLSITADAGIKNGDKLIGAYA